MSKYHNVKTVMDGHVFDSKHEADRYRELLVLHNAGEITGLTLQPIFPIVIDGELICKYIADFKYTTTRDDKIVVEDAKGIRTPVYQLKKKLVKALYGIDIVEV